VDVGSRPASLSSANSDQAGWWVIYPAVSPSRIRVPTPHSPGLVENQAQQASVDVCDAVPVGGIGAGVGAQRVLLQLGVDPSVGSVGDAYEKPSGRDHDRPLQAEKIHREGPWKTLADVELATLEWVDWYNHERLHSAAGDLPPAEYEDLYLTEAETQ